MTRSQGDGPHTLEVKQQDEGRAEGRGWARAQIWVLSPEERAEVSQCDPRSPLIPAWPGHGLQPASTSVLSRERTHDHRLVWWWWWGKREYRQRVWPCKGTLILTAIPRYWQSSYAYGLILSSESIFYSFTCLLIIIVIFILWGFVKNPSPTIYNYWTCITVNTLFKKRKLI